MNYRIKLAYQGGRQNHIGNLLNGLDGAEYATRDEACETIYAALEGVVMGDGCEMLAIADYCDENNDHWLDNYCTACYNLIMREGRATEDGVTATVEEVA